MQARFMLPYISQQNVSSMTSNNWVKHKLVLHDKHLGNRSRVSVTGKTNSHHDYYWLSYCFFYRIYWHSSIS